MNILDTILTELQTKPLGKSGKALTFGIVNRRSLPADYSRQCWMRPRLYKLLLDYAAATVTIPYTTIQVTHNYKGKLKHSVGDVFQVTFGDYTDGSTNTRQPYTGPLPDVHLSGVTGDRYCITFYTQDLQGVDTIPAASVISSGNKWLFKRGNVVIKNGQPAELKGKLISRLGPSILTFL